MRNKVLEPWWKNRKKSRGHIFQIDDPELGPSRTTDEMDGGLLPPNKC